jgi:hypothetical protein
MGIFTATTGFDGTSGSRPRRAGGNSHGGADYRNAVATWVIGPVKG